MSQIVLVTGASSGIGLEAARSLAKFGHTVYGTLRPSSKTLEFEKLKADFPNRVHTSTLDVTDEESIAQAVKELIAKEGRIDVLVNNAGFGIVGNEETTTVEEAQRMFDVNVFGCMRMVQAVAPHMREKKYGKIINISSVAGVFPSPGASLYSATKAAVESMSETLAGTLAPFGVEVKVVEPGPVQTHFGDAMKNGTRKPGPNNPYEAFIQNYRDLFDEILPQGQPASEVGDLICTIVNSNNKTFRYPTSDDAFDLINRRIKEVDGVAIIDEQKERVMSRMT